ncbi:hypothetical protein BD560DRAFT_476335 [Blakeslea trispora]|nr:hypothetical protein BD560DRAFT_476335 [Blakeslea trispora]
MPFNFCRLGAHVEWPWVFSNEDLSDTSNLICGLKFGVKSLNYILAKIDTLFYTGGDTMSSTCKNVGLRFKLDLWILILRGDKTVVDGVTGEIAKKSTKAKLYNDRLKSVVTTKGHLNAFLESLRFISKEDIIKVFMPVVQAMVLEAKASSLRLIGKRQYAMEDLHSFKFPGTLAELKLGELECLIHDLTLNEEIVNSLETKFKDRHTEKESRMDRILKETKKKKGMILSDVTWDANDEKSEDEESKADSNEESDSNNQRINDETTNNDFDGEY